MDDNDNIPEGDLVLFEQEVQIEQVQNETDQVDLPNVFDEIAAPDTTKKRKKTTNDEKLIKYWENMEAKSNSQGNWMDISILSNETYLSKGTIYCKICLCSISVGINTGNFTKHAESLDHKTKLNMELNKGQTTLTSYAKGYKNDDLIRLRSLWHSSLISSGVSGNMISQIMSSNSDKMKIRSFLVTNQVKSIGNKDTIGTDLEKSSVMVQNYLKNLLKGEFVALIVDGPLLSFPKLLPF